MDRRHVESWNPLRGCIKVSPGCKHCYAETFAERFRGVSGHPYEQGFDPRLVPAKLAEPFDWTGPLTVFVNSMSDLFTEGRYRGRWWVMRNKVTAQLGREDEPISSATPQMEGQSPRNHEERIIIAKLKGDLEFHERTGHCLPYESILMAHGRFFDPSPFPKHLKRGRMKQCYMNAFSLASDHPSQYFYCEGYACSKGIKVSVMHAWCVDRHRRVVDPTWKGGTAYFGVEFEWQYVLAAVLGNRQYGPVPEWDARLCVEENLPRRAFRRSGEAFW